MHGFTPDTMPWEMPRVGELTRPEAAKVLAELGVQFTDDEIAAAEAYMESFPQPPPTSPPDTSDHRRPASDPLARMSKKQIFTDCVWISEEASSTKIFLLCIARFFDKDAKNSSMSYTQISSDCSLSDRTCMRAAKDARERWLRIGVQKGFKTTSGPQNLYHGSPPAHLIEELRRRKLKGVGVDVDPGIAAAAEAMTPCHPSGEEGVTPCHTSGQGVTLWQSRGDTDDTLTPITPTEENKKKKKSAARDADATIKREYAQTQGQARQPSTFPSTALVEVAPAATPCAEPMPPARGSGEIVPAAASWLPPELAQPLEVARRQWMSDPHGIAGGITLETIEASIGSLALSLREQGFADAHIRAGVIEAIAEIGPRAIDKAAAKAGGAGAAFVAYLSKVIKSKVRQIDKDARARDADIDATAGKAATDKVIQGKRVAAFDQAVANGQARTGAARPNGTGNRGARYTTDDQGRDVFEPSAKLRLIGYHNLSGADCNVILRNAREYLPDIAVPDVEDALIAVSRAVGKKRSVEIGDIIDKAVEHIRAQHAYAAHGTPEQLAGGKAAVLDYGRKMEAPMIVLSDAKVGVQLHGHRHHAPSPVADVAWAAWLVAKGIAEEAGWPGYGDTQAKAEQAFERHLADTLEKMAAERQEQARASKTVKVDEAEARQLEEEEAIRRIRARGMTPTPGLMEKEIGFIRMGG